jgi:hypothetical protein
VLASSDLRAVISGDYDDLSPLHHPHPLSSPPPLPPPPCPPEHLFYADDPVDLPLPTESARKHAAAACTEKQYPEVKGDGAMGEGEGSSPFGAITRARKRRPPSFPLLPSPPTFPTSSTYEPATPPAPTRNTDRDDGKTRELSTRAHSLPSKFTEPRETPAKEIRKKELFEMRKKMGDFELLEIMAHEACQSASGGFKYPAPPRLPIPRGGVPDHSAPSAQASLTSFGKKGCTHWRR